MVTWPEGILWTVAKGVEGVHVERRRRSLSPLILQMLYEVRPGSRRGAFLSRIREIMDAFDVQRTLHADIGQDHQPVVDVAAAWMVGIRNLVKFILTAHRHLLRRL